MNKKFLKLTLLAVAFAFILSGVAMAEPKVEKSSSSVIFYEAVTPEFIEQAKQLAGNKLSFTIGKCKNEDLAALAKAFPGMTKLNMENNEGITDLSPLAGLTALTYLRIYKAEAADLSPIAELVNLTSINIDSVSFKNEDLEWMRNLTKLGNIYISGANSVKSFEGLPSLPNLTNIILRGAAPEDLTPLVTALPGLTKIDFMSSSIKDLAPLSKLAKLKDLDIYGVKVKDFTPLAECKNLKKLNFYATEGADYSTLATLKQCEELKGGLTAMDSIAWMNDMPNLKITRIFAEKVKDYSPISKTKLTELTIWSMKEPVGDLGFLKPVTTLTKLAIHGNNDVANFAAIGALTELTELNLNNVNEKSGSPVDLSFCANLSKLETLNINSTKVTNFKDVAGLKGLKKIEMQKVSGIDSLEPLKVLSNLNSIYVSKGVFTPEQLKVLPETVKISER